MSRWSVVLAGGIGSRFWPLSTPERPKQLLPLVDEAPLLVNAVGRLDPLVPLEHVLVLTSEALVEPIAALLPELPRENLIAEPRPAGTAAALTWAASEIAHRDAPDAVMISVHADWAVGDAAGFRARLDRAAAAAERHEALITVGIVPTRADPGFGYIQPSDEVEPELFRVARFVEKPDRERAEEMRREGYLWNSGIFVWRVGDFLDEVRRHTPEIAPALDAAGPVEDGIKRFFAGVNPVSVDVGVLERSDRVMVMPGDFRWDDVGTWSALRRVRQLDAAGNALSGDVHAQDASGNVVHAEGNTVVLYGVSNLVVVSRNGLTLVTTVDRSQDLKALIETLPPALRPRS